VQRLRRTLILAGPLGAHISVHGVPEWAFPGGTGFRRTLCDRKFHMGDGGYILADATLYDVHCPDTPNEATIGRDSRAPLLSLEYLRACPRQKYCVCGE
jgi:hypothetical protein